MTDPGTVHVIGAGMAGLSAAVDLTKRGYRIALYEAGVQAGGRCRSYLDKELGCRIDNGNHLLLAGNGAVLDYATTIGTAQTLVGPVESDFPFIDLADGTRWTLRINRGRLPWWVASTARRVPGSTASNYLEALRLRGAGPNASVMERLDPSTLLFRRLWAPIAIAALNTELETASAALLWHIFIETFGRGGAACRPLVPAIGLSESLVDPALTWLQEHGAELHFGRRLRSFGFGSNRVESLTFTDSDVPLSASDRVILAVPAPVASDLIEDLTAPTEFRAIVNLHYRIDDAQPVAGEPSFIGVIGGISEWIFVKQGVLSVTISAADRFVDSDAEEIATKVWQEVARCFNRDGATLPPWRVVKEKRATFAATPSQLARRPGPSTRWKNLYLAGDWTATGLPSTIEGAVRSGCTAATQLVADSQR